MSIFARLQFDSSFQGGNVTPMSNSVIKHMDAMPAMLTDWQKSDIGSSNVGGYFQNPVANTTASIWTVANNIIAITGLASSNVTQISTAANGLSISANNFMAHTNRMSGVTQFDYNNPTAPTYQSAIGIGKLLSYIVYQSDGVQNNAPMIGSFSSLYTSSNLTSYYTTIQNYVTQVQNSIIATSDGLGGYTYSSNLTQTQANTIATNLSTAGTFMDTRRTADVTFYTNSQAVVSDYNSVRSFTNMGQTETTMVNNLIGTPKTLSRINS